MNKIKNMIKKVFGIKTGFQDWNTYKQNIDFLDAFTWQQQVRKDNISKMPGVAQ